MRYCPIRRCTGSRDRQRKLFGEMIGERGLRGDEGFEIVVARRSTRRRPIRCKRSARHPARRARRPRPALRRRRSRDRCRRSAPSRRGCRDRGPSTARRPPRNPRQRRPGRLDALAGAVIAVSGAVLGRHFAALGGGFARDRRLGPSLARSSSGLRSSSSSTNATRSRLDSCSSLIACISCGVITSDCVCRNSRRCVSAIEARTDPGNWSDSCLALSEADVQT